MNPTSTIPKSKSYKLVEKRNPLACHGIFKSLERAERHLQEVIPVYVERGFFIDKTLKAEDFKIIQYPG